MWGCSSVEKLQERGRVNRRWANSRSTQEVSSRLNWRQDNKSVSQIPTSRTSERHSDLCWTHQPVFKALLYIPPAGKWIRFEYETLNLQTCLVGRRYWRWLGFKPALIQLYVVSPVFLYFTLKYANEALQTLWNLKSDSCNLNVMVLLYLTVLWFPGFKKKSKVRPELWRSFLIAG